MKLGKLNAAIDAAPTVYIRTTKYGLVALQKGSIKQRLKEKHVGGRSEETGIKLDDDFAFAPDTDPEE